ncbi:SWIRM domain-containing protein FUN19 [Phyllosticta citriasiana]|uniref:SWIRM domain-containing protein FUN19 n=1 Tax=Phyllosticta citriasiana TaxID=595635 RepID=A0ABR1L0Z5_9PEZI
MDSLPPTTQKLAKPLSVSSLLSPPEMKRSDSFSKSPIPPHVASASSNPAKSSPFTDSIRHTTVHAVPSNVRASTQGLPPSPPVSPYEQTHKEDSQGSVVEDTSRDPPLFPPSTSGDRIDTTAPLFPSTSSTPEHDNIISQHIAATAPRNTSALPSRSDYELAISFRSCVFDLFSRNPREYLRNERATWHVYGRGAGNKQRCKPLKQLAPAPAGVRKTKPATVRVQRAPRNTKRTPKAVALDSFEGKPAATPKPPRVVTARDDVDFRSIPDYSPPLSTLPEDGRKIMKTDWKGPPLDLSTDPDRELLHPSELIMAGVLRLSCATYIANKRRIFAARVKALQKGEDFNKTKAQQACKIDVNKASKLWSAYDRIGWFKPHHFQKYLGSVIEFDQ